MENQNNTEASTSITNPLREKLAKVNWKRVAIIGGAVAATAVAAGAVLYVRSQSNALDPTNAVDLQIVESASDVVDTVAPAM